MLWTERGNEKTLDCETSGLKKKAVSVKNVQFSDEKMINKMKKTGDADCSEQR